MASLRNFTSFHHPLHGNCYTFNSGQGGKILTTSTGGSENGESRRGCGEVGAGQRRREQAGLFASHWRFFLTCFSVVSFRCGLCPACFCPPQGPSVFQPGVAFCELQGSAHYFFSPGLFRSSRGSAFAMCPPLPCKASLSVQDRSGSR